MKCRNCDQDIHFDDSMVSQKGKKIPLQGLEGIEKHDCPNNPYKKDVFKGMPEANTTYRERQPEPDNTTLLETIARVGKLELAIQELRETGARQAQGLNELGEAIAKMSFQKGTGEGL